MAFLDRFKIQPKHKSPDPEVRVASVQELGAEPEDGAVLVALATEDPDARVRRAAAAGALTDQKQIATVAKTSSIDSVRADAVARLTDVKSLSSVARHAADPR